MKEKEASPEFKYSFEKEIWEDWMRRLRKAQETPDVETVSFDVKKDKEVLRRALQGEWWSVVQEIEELSGEALWRDNRLVIKKHCEDAIFHAGVLLDNFEKSLTGEDREHFDRDAYAQDVLERFVEKLGESESRLKEGYKKIKYGWHGTVDIRFNIDYKGLPQSEEFYGMSDGGVLLPTLELMGVLYRLGIPVDSFAEDWFQRYYADQSEHVIAEWRAEWMKEWSQFNNKLGVCVRQDITASVSIEEFGVWLWNCQEKGEVLSPDGFKTTVRLDGDAITKWVDDIGYIHEYGGSALNNNFNRIEIGAGARLYCMEGKISAPLTLSHPLTILYDRDAVRIDRDGGGSVASLHCVDVQRERARSRLEDVCKKIERRDAGSWADIEQAVGGATIELADITPVYKSQLTLLFPEVPVCQAISRPLDAADLHHIVTKDMYDFLKTEEGVAWSAKQNAPIVMQLFGIMPVPGVVQFANECGLSVGVQDQDGRTPLHKAMEVMGKSWVIFQNIMSLTSWMTKESLAVKDNNGETPLDIFLKSKNIERMTSWWKGEVPLKVIHALDDAGVDLCSKDVRVGDRSIAEALGFAGHAIVERQLLMKAVPERKSRIIPRV